MAFRSTHLSPELVRDTPLESIGVCLFRIFLGRPYLAKAPYLGQDRCDVFPRATLFLPLSRFQGSPFLSPENFPPSCRRTSGSLPFQLQGEFVVTLHPCKFGAFSAPMFLDLSFAWFCTLLPLFFIRSCHSRYKNASPFDLDLFPPRFRHCFFFDRFRLVSSSLFRRCKYFAFLL